MQDPLEARFVEMRPLCRCCAGAFVHARRKGSLVTFLHVARSCRKRTVWIRRLRSVLLAQALFVLEFFVSCFKGHGFACPHRRALTWACIFAS